MRGGEGRGGEGRGICRPRTVCVNKKLRSYSTTSKWLGYIDVCNLPTAIKPSVMYIFAEQC